MDCSSSKCDQIADCKCYAYKSKKFPYDNQICGYRHGDKIFPCEATCCAGGGCPGQCKGVQSRPPFAITDDIFIPFRYDLRKNTKRVLYVLIILVILSTLILNVRKRK